MLSLRPVLNPAAVECLQLAGAGDLCLSLVEHACYTAAATFQPDGLL